MGDILVTIFCTTFNHQKYIARTLSSFLNQKVNFEYEILVHDDASMDGTQDVIRSFLDKYPQKINAILQVENQWKKGINFMRDIAMPYAKGKYIAVCEGDDYWLDEYKLQKQVDYMESHPGCTFCFTNALIENVQNGKRRVFIPYSPKDKDYINSSGDYDLTSIAKLSFIPNCTFLFPKSNLYKVPESFFDKYYCGDRRSTLYFTSLGYAHFINDNSGCYNYGVEGSAMTRYKTKKQLAMEELTFARLYQNIDEFTEHKYSKEMENYIVYYLSEVYYLQGNNQLLTESDFKYIEGKLSLTVRIKRIIFSVVSDKMFNKIRSAKRKLFV